MSIDGQDVRGTDIKGVVRLLDKVRSAKTQMHTVRVMRAEAVPLKKQAFIPQPEPEAEKEFTVGPFKTMCRYSSPDLSRIGGGCVDCANVCQLGSFCHVIQCSVPVLWSMYEL